jgi:hypothetical protein
MKKAVRMLRRSVLAKYCFSGALLLGVVATGAYIVKKGDTLWDLSSVFRNDPFKWPDLWAENKHIADPHWIYPGDSLNIDGATDAPADTISKVEAAESIEPSAEPAPDSLLPKGIKVTMTVGSSRDAEFQRNLGILPNRIDTSLSGGSHGDSTLFTYRKSPAPTVFNKYYQILAPRLIPRATMRDDAKWLRLTTGDKKPPLRVHTGDELLVKIGRKASPHKPGSLMELWLVEPISFKGSKDSIAREYALVRLAGFAKVESVGDTLTRVIVERTLTSIDIAKAKALIPEEKKTIKVSRYEEVSGLRFEKMPQVKYALDPTLVIGAYTYVIADAGTAVGLNPGDGVAFLENEILDPTLPPRTLGRGIVVSVGANESCILVRELLNPSRRIDRGNRVALTHRATL